MTNNKRNLLSAAMGLALAGIALPGVSAAGTIPGYADAMPGNSVVTNNYGECVKEGFWTAADAIPKCEGIMDSDGDGVYDDKDKCPGTPKGVKVDAMGCPLDSDGDGVLDGDDACPDTAKGVKVDAKGCEVIDKIVIPGVNFSTDSAALSGDATAAIEAAAAAINRNIKSVSEVMVTGHTDSTGADAYNQALSEKRAQSVAKALESNGVSMGKMSVSGAGESSPVADNATAEGRAANRRVEIDVKM